MELRYYRGWLDNSPINCFMLKIARNNQDQNIIKFKIAQPCIPFTGTQHLQF